MIHLEPYIKNPSVGNLFVAVKHRVVNVNIENGDRTLNFTIMKVEQKYGKSYLNVMIDKITAKKGIFDENHGGLMGHISKREYKFYTSVQRDESARVVKDDGILTKNHFRLETLILRLRKDVTT